MIRFYTDAENERRIGVLKAILEQKENEAESEFGKWQCYGGNSETYLNLLAQIAGIENEIKKLEELE